jgi:hypothetical protein
VSIIYYRSFELLSLNKHYLASKPVQREREREKERDGRKDSARHFHPKCTVVLRDSSFTIFKVKCCLHEEKPDVTYHKCCDR